MTVATPKVFISHSTEDREFIDREIVSTLKNKGIDTWLATEEILASENWQKAIRAGLTACDWFLLVMSPRSAESQWVEFEFNWAMKHRPGRIVPVLMETCEPEDFHLGSALIQSIDYRESSTEAKEKLLQTFSIAKVAPDAVASGSKLLSAEAVLRAPRYHFHCGTWVPAEFFVGRHEELEEAKELIESRQNFLVVGRPGAGKTSFCQKLKTDIDDDPDCGLLAGYVNLRLENRLTIDAFLRRTLLNIVGEMARELFHCGYTDLKQHNSATSHSDKTFRKFVDIFGEIRKRTHKRTSPRSVLQPDQLPELEFDRDPESLLDHEFVSLAKELLDIAAQKGRPRFVMLYDEANNLAVNISSHLLVGIGEALGQTGVIGGYAASPKMLDRFESMNSLFGAHLSLGPFQSYDDMLILLARYYFDHVSHAGELPATEAALQTIWEASRGEPLLIQLIADRSFRTARRERASQLDQRHVVQAYDVLKKERSMRVFP